MKYLLYNPETDRYLETPGNVKSWGPRANAFHFETDVDANREGVFQKENHPGIFRVDIHITTDNPAYEDGDEEDEYP